MFAWKSGQQIGTFGNKIATWPVYLNVQPSILNDKEVKRFGSVCLKCYGHLMYENQCVISRLVIDIVLIQLSMNCCTSTFKRKEDLG